jgi:HEAT repeat protein
MMEDRSGVVRRWAAGALSGIGTRAAAATAVPAMIAGLEGQDVPTRASILAALGRLARSHESVIPALLRALEDPSDGIRMAAVDALGEHIGSHRDVVLPVLLKVLEDPSQGVRFQAGWRLGKSRPAAMVVPLLIEELNKGEPLVRAVAAGALWHLHDAIDAEPEVIRRAVEALAAALADRDAQVREAAVGSLQALGGAARAAEPALRAAMDDPSRSVRDKASAALQWIAASRPGG